MSTEKQIIAFPLKTAVATHVTIDLGALAKVKADIQLASQSTNGGALTAIDVSDYALAELGLNLYDLELSDVAVATAGHQLVVVSGSTINRNEIQLFRAAKNANDVYSDLGSAALKVSPATDSVDAAAIKADAVTKIGVGVWASTTRELTSLGATAISGIWNAATSGIVTAGSIGKLIKDNLDMVLSTVNTAVAGVKAKTDLLQFDGSNYVKAVPQSAAPLSTADKNDIADRIWDELGTGHVNDGSMGLMMHRMKAYAYGKRKLTSGGTVEEIYDEDGATLISTHALTLVDGKVTERGART